MDTDLDRARTDSIAFLKRHTTGVLATVSPEGNAHSRILYYVCDSNFNIFFCTLTNTRKYADLAANPRASFTVATEDVPQTLQIEGTVSELSDEQKIVSGIAPLIETLMSNSAFRWPVLKLKPGEVVLMQLKPVWVRWADYAFAESGPDRVFVQIPVDLSA